MSVQQSAERVWLDVPGFHAAEYASSVHGAQARILETLGIPPTYDDLICYGAFAFRVQAHEEMCPSAGHPAPGFMCIENSNRALPWREQSYFAFPWDAPREDQVAFEADACAAIKDSIDRGVPVHYGSEEDGLIIGYGGAGRRWWCVHPYHQNGREAFWFDEASGFAGGKWPWGINVWTAPKTAEELVPARELFTAALRQAVAMWHTEKCGAYAVGEAAYAHWLTWLRGTETPCQGNGWYFDVLIHSRRIAGRWLAQRADDYPEIAAPLREAAAHYTDIAEECMDEIGCAWDLTSAAKGTNEWPTRLRLEEIARLESAVVHDRAAIAALERALAELGTDSRG